MFVNAWSEQKWAGANFTVVGIDPGTDTVGFAAMTYSPVEKRIVKTVALTLVGSKLITDDYFVETHGERVRRVANLQDSLFKLLVTFWPSYTGCEKPFFNMMRPGAFEPLLEGLSAVSGALWRFDPCQRLMTIDPPTAKKAIGASGGAKKDQMLLALLTVQDILNYDPWLSGRPIHLLDEHSVDAIAICKWTLDSIIKL